MKRHRNSAQARRICWDANRKQDHLGHYMICQGPDCGARIDPVRKGADAWQADHYPVKWTDGGEDVPDNLRPLCRDCFEKINPEDWKQISKGKRMGSKHFSMKDRRPWR